MQTAQVINLKHSPPAVTQSSTCICVNSTGVRDAASRRMGCRKCVFGSFSTHIQRHVKQCNHKPPQTSRGKVRSLLQTYNAVTTHTPKTLCLSSSLTHTVFTYTAACAVLSVLCVCSCGKNKKGRE